MEGSEHDDDDKSPPGEKQKPQKETSDQGDEETDSSDENRDNSNSSDEELDNFLRNILDQMLDNVLGLSGRSGIQSFHRAVDDNNVDVVTRMLE